MRDDGSRGYYCLWRLRDVYLPDGLLANTSVVSLVQQVGSIASANAPTLEYETFLESECATREAVLSVGAYLLLVETQGQVSLRYRNFGSTANGSGMCWSRLVFWLNGEYDGSGKRSSTTACSRTVEERHKQRRNGILHLKLVEVEILMRAESIWSHGPQASIVERLSIRSLKRLEEWPSELLS
ncbi:hypothetical protein BDV98DRAFT_586611 [Pterulicium gracile]|uniref:Uncharacterized protein n=1 Tax=Pterulicium gracile TaxID=1884261 RepID=A0A5C3QCA0_9AGAR|nr:hypothetical protein BDV98DRAFT_586611 [Pterula gracilis]